MITSFADVFRSINNPWLVLSLDLLVKATLLLLLGLAVAHWQKRAAAAVRHRVWCLTFSGLLLLPVLEVSLPSWRLPLLPASNVVAAAAPATTEPMQALDQPPAPAPVAVTMDSTMAAKSVAIPPQDMGIAAQSSASFPLQTNELQASLPAPLPQPVAKTESLPSPEMKSQPTQWSNWLLWGWAAGFFLVMLPLIASLIHNWLLGRSSLHVSDGEPFQLLDRLCQSLKLKRRVRLLETPRALIPMTWGIFRPVVLLPHSARAWTAERKRFVLLHELAHIKRCDVAFQMLARTVCALYWFHPLVWYGLKRLREERELACDDCVLMTGERPADCAQQLVAIARSYRLLAMSSAVAMAETSNLEQRVRALLDQKRSRKPVSRRLAAWSVFVASLLITVVAVVRLEAKAPPAKPSDDVAEKSDEPQKATNQAADNTQDSSLHFRGQVLDPDGKPVKGAKLYFVSWVHTDLSRVEFKPEAVTDAEGRFEFRPKPTDLPPGVGQSYWNGTLAAMAEGYGFGAEMSLPFETTGEAKRRLDPALRESIESRLAGKKAIIRLASDDKPITGQVLNTEGRPVPHATVEVVDVSYSEDGSLDAWEQTTKEPKADYYSTRRTTPLGMNGPQLRAVIPPVQTDAEGNFTLKGIGSERLVELLIRGPGIETEKIKARTRDGQIVTLPNTWDSRSFTTSKSQLMERYHPAQLTHVAAPSKPVIGRVIDADTQKPVAGVKISVGRLGSFTATGKHWIFTHTDQEGKYRLEGMTIGNHWLYAYPPDDSDYLPAGSDGGITTKTDEPSVTKDFVLRKGILVRGKAIDGRTGEPLSGQVSYFTEAANPHLENYSGFTQLRSEYERRADERGRFTIPVPPGRGMLTFLPDDHASFHRGVGATSIPLDGERSGSSKLFRTVPIGLYSHNKCLLRYVEVTPDSEPLEITLNLTSGFKVTGRLVDEEGKPLAGCLINGRSGFGAWYPVEGHEFQVEGYYTEWPRDLYFHHPERDLAAHYRLEGDPPKDLSITLTKAGGLRGRVVDDAGAPIPEVRLMGEGVPGENYGNAKLRMATDENGRFEIRGLVPDRKYTVYAYGDDIYGRLLTDVTVKASETKDVGDVKIEPIRRGDDTTANPPAAVNVAAKPKPTEEETVTVHGRVLLPDGSPAKNATVRAAAPVLATQKGYEDFEAKVSTAQTDAQGQFTISVSKLPFGDVVTRDPKWRDYRDYWKHIPIAASMPGYGPDWISVGEVNPKEPVTLKLAEELPIRGRIVDLEGKPVAGLTLRINAPGAPRSGDLSEWIKAAKAGELPWVLQRHLKLVSSPEQLGTPTSAITDQDGRFEVRGFGRERMVRMTFEGETVAHQSISILTRDIPMFDRAIVQASGSGIPKEPVLGAEFTFTAAPSRPIEGTIVDAKTRQPLAGVAVESYRLAGTPIVNQRMLKTVSDDKGRFHMLGMPQGEGNRLMLLPNDEQPYLMREIDVPNPAGLGPVDMTVELHKGIWIKGRVTDKSTGEPVHASLFFMPYRTNTFAQAVPEFGNEDGGEGDQNRYQTKPDGSYRIVGLPGQAVVGAFSFGKTYRAGAGYSEIKGPKDPKTGDVQTYSNPGHPRPEWPHVMAEIDAPADVETVTVNLQMDPGLSVPLVLVDPEGEPLTNVFVTGQGNPTFRTTQIEGHTLEAVNFSSEETRTMLFYHEERKLAAVKRIAPPNDGKAVTVKLEPVSRLTGRLLHVDGSPITGGRMEATLQLEDDYSTDIPGEFITDGEGRFEILLYPGAPYRVHVEAVGVDEGYASVIRDLETEPGAVKDLGDLYHVQGENKFESRKKAESSSASPSP